MSLNNRQLRFLRGLSHKLNPVVMVADKGLTENVLAEIENALEHHELIKVKLRADREQRARWIEEIRAGSGAEIVHSIGQVVSLYRRNPKKPVIELPN
jgi:RNA-binding protein